MPVIGRFCYRSAPLPVIQYCFRNEVAALCPDHGVKAPYHVFVMAQLRQRYPDRFDKSAPIGLVPQRMYIPDAALPFAMRRQIPILMAEIRVSIGQVGNLKPVIPDALMIEHEHIRTSFLEMRGNFGYRSRLEPVIAVQEHQIVAASMGNANIPSFSGALVLFILNDSEDAFSAERSSTDQFPRAVCGTVIDDDYLVILKGMIDAARQRLPDEFFIV